MNLKNTQTDAALAAVVARLFASDPWSQFARYPQDVFLADPSLFAATALELYDVAAPVDRANAASAENVASPVVIAAALVGDIGDGYAASLSPLSPLDRQGLPSRDAAEWFVTEYGVSEWAERLGFPLELRKPNNDAPPNRGVLFPKSTNPADAPDNTAVAGFFGNVLLAYERFIVLRREDLGREWLDSDAARSSMGGTITECRRWASWIRDNLAEDLLPIASSILYMCRSCFVMQRDPDRSDILYPRETLKALLDVCDSRGWLIAHGLELPEWLS